MIILHIDNIDVYVLIFIPHTTSCEGYNVLIWITPFLNLKFYQNERYYWNNSSEAVHRISWNFVVMKDLMCRYAFLQEMLIWSFKVAIYIPFELMPKLFCATQIKTSFLCICLSLMLGIAICCIQHSQTMFGHGVCELAHSFFHLKSEIMIFLYLWCNIVYVHSRLFHL